MKDIQFKPSHLNARKLTNFKKWLCAKGCQLLVTTNQYEVVRFKAGDVVSIIYRKDNGDFTFTGESRKVLNSFTGKQKWTPPQKKKRERKSSVIMRTIRKRDGDNCFFCNKVVSMEEETQEHLVPVIHGGPSHISNLFLSCKPCNLKAGHKSAVEKIKMRDAARTIRGESYVR